MIINNMSNYKVLKIKNNKYIVRIYNKKKKI